MRVRQWLIVLVTTAVVTAACSGEDGAPGLQGPPGTANVISGRDTVSNADWSTTTTQEVLSTGTSSASGGKVARFLDLNVPQLTAAVHDGGVVLVWMQVNPSGVIQSAQAFVQLPWDFVFLLASQMFHYDLDITPGRIRVLFFVENLADPSVGIDPLVPVQATRIFRWVIIPPAALSLLQSVRRDDGPEAVLAALAARGFTAESMR